MTEDSGAGPSFYEQCIGTIQKAAEGFPDLRRGRNKRHTISDTVMSAFAVFFLQSPSWLSCQRAMQGEQGKNNAWTLFGVENVPVDNHVRNLLDPAEPKLLHGAYHDLLSILEEHGVLERFKALNGQMLIALDGTDFHSSEKISCPNCLVTRYQEERIFFSHKAVTPVIVAPGVRQAVPLRPEFCAPQDGSQKQDCEINASKRWLDDASDWLRKMQAVLLGDDIYAHVPFCRKAQGYGLHFIFTCLRESHKALYEWIDFLEPCDFQTVAETRRDSDGHKRTWNVRFTKGLPLSGKSDTLCVNWVELTVTDANRDMIYRNCWVTDLDVEIENAVEIAACGRARWKIENGNNNLLKTKGYHLKHNFGHGKKYLANTLASLNILAFLAHTVLELISQHHAAIRARLGSRREFFLHLHVLTIYHQFQSWGELENFIMRALEIGSYAPTAPPELTSKGLIRRYAKRKHKNP